MMSDDDVVVNYAIVSVWWLFTHGSEHNIIFKIRRNVEATSFILLLLLLLKSSI